MCFFEQIMFECGDWKWDRFRAHCTREYRIGETCGMKFIEGTNFHSEKCKTCQKIETKERRRNDQYEKLQRWELQGNRLKASIEKARQTIVELDQEIAHLQAERVRKNQSTGKIR